MYEYIAAGVITGGCYKFNMGLRGMAAGGIVGAVAGGCSLAILKATGMTMEEIRYWQYKWRSSRDDAIQETFRESVKEDTDRTDSIIHQHDDKVGRNAMDIKKIIADEADEIRKQVKEENEKKAK
jgi:complex I assembly factor TIMMDC1